jgi:hypothetical protein
MRNKTARVLEWIAYANRPLKMDEILSGMGVTETASKRPKLNAVSAKVLDFCQPLVEVSRTGIVEFIHFSVTESVVDLFLPYTGYM